MVKPGNATQALHLNTDLIPTRNLADLKSAAFTVSHKHTHSWLPFNSLLILWGVDLGGDDSRESEDHYWESNQRMF